MISDRGSHRSKWVIRKFANDEEYRRWLSAGTPVLPKERVVEIDGNLFLNEGIGEILDLACGLGGTAFSNANARLGVGDDATAAAAGQTGLQAAVNKLYKAMEATYPQRTNQTVTFRAVFGSDEANFHWQEFTVANGASDASKNWNRKVQDGGTKVAGATWTLDLELSIS